MQAHSPPDLTRITLQVLWIGILIVATFWITRPILPSVIWAGMIVAASWPVMLKLERWFWGKRGLAAAAMTVLILLFFIVPSYLAVAAILENVDRITGWVNQLKTEGMPPLPEWVAGLPVVGPKLADSWQRMAAGPEGLSERLAPYARAVLTWFLSQAGSIGWIAIQFLLTVITAAILYSKGDIASDGVLRFARRLGGHQGQEVAVLAARTVRAVALGVVGTALLQSLLGSIGLAVCGVPAVAILSALMFILCIAQLGPAPVLVPSVIWLYYDGQTTWGTVLLVWAVFASTFDNFLRPFLIRMGAELPLLLIFAGVIGGLATFGIAGLFIGPVVLAVTYRLIAAWVNGT